MKKNLYSLGLMSGTSLDGIDVSIIKSDGEQYIEIIDNLYIKYENQLKLKLKKIIDSCSSKDQLLKKAKEIKELENEFTLCNANACRLITEKNKKIKIDLIGFHGQTIIHNPKNRYSIQIGDARLLAKITDTIVVSNFRENDIASGGQGAPLTPIYHQLILTKIQSKLPSAVVNIGGIANITYIDKYEKIIGFDTGPGNYLIDEWIRINSKLEFDRNGVIAKSGQIDVDILNKFLEDTYYKKKHPKSLDIKYFNLKNLNKLNLEDGSATLSMLTVKSICLAINSFSERPNVILISGGGRKNKFVVDNIRKILKKKILLVDEFDFDGDFVESQAFAYLAIRSYLKKNITFPSTTGVKKPCSGGLLFKN